MGTRKNEIPLLNLIDIHNYQKDKKPKKPYNFIIWSFIKKEKINE
jgi:hypothetical protein